MAAATTPFAIRQALEVLASKLPVLTLAIGKINCNSHKAIETWNIVMSAHADLALEPSSSYPLITVIKLLEKRRANFEFDKFVVLAALMTTDIVSSVGVSEDPMVLSPIGAFVAC